MIPHITDEIKRRMRLQASESPKPDVIITEIGGTVGDIESQPFIESARQVRHELGRKNVFFVHVSLVPFMGASGEQKTKRRSTPSRRCAPSASSPTRSCCAATGPSRSRTSARSP